MQKLETENRKLKHLLFSLGLRYRSIDEYLRTADNPVTARKVAIPGLQRSCSRSPAPNRIGNDAAGSGNQELSTDTPTVQATPEIHPDTLSPNSEWLEKYQKSDPVCSCPPDDDDSAWPADEDVLNTTLCAIAAEMISQYNTRGVGREEIEKKLWAGFRKGLSSGGGCRVQNQVLFQVLDEISND